MASPAIRALLEPHSIALIGASDTEGSLGQVVLANLLEAGFAGDLALVNPGHDLIAGRPAVPSVVDLPQPPELAIIVTPAATVPDVIDACGAAGIRAAIVLSAGFREVGAEGLALEREVLARAQHQGLRFIGPNCLGVIRTPIGFDATFSAGSARRGRIAVVSQSGALCTAILDWAQTNSVGFSSLVSLGIAADVGFAEVLDFLASDRETDSIMLYIEGVPESRRFMSALRAASRVKPVVAIKAGRHAAGSRAVLTHTGAIVGADDVFDAALRRAGVLRVHDFADFFAAAETLDSGMRCRGNRLLIVTNAGGPGVLAADHCVDRDVALAELSPATIARLDAALPAAWSRSNPVDLLGDAPPERYVAALRACLDDPGVDGVLVVLTPQAQSQPEAVARSVLALAANHRVPLLTCWMGGETIASSRVLLREGNLPTFGTPESAVDGFAYLASHAERQKQLLQVPEPLELETPPDVEGARTIIETILADGRTIASLAESKALLAAFSIPILRSVPARTVADAALIASELGFPVALKIDSPDVTHKSDVGGVVLGVRGVKELYKAWTAMMERVGAAVPDARLDGALVEPMWQGGYGRELMVGVLDDAVFGPVLSFGLGGTLVEVLHDRAVALPPLNRFLARALVDGTRAATWLAPFRGAPAADRQSLERLLLRVSEMVCALPWIEAMDLNPVMVDEHGAIVLDARIVLRRWGSAHRPYDHMAIHPYPKELVGEHQLSDGTAITIRPIRPEDALLEKAFVGGLSERTRYLRFFYNFGELPLTQLSRFTQIDYDRDMALIAVHGDGAAARQVGVARYADLDEGRTCEFAIVVADAWQGRGLAAPLMSRLIDTARARRFELMQGSILHENKRMLAFVRGLGFETVTDPKDPDLVMAQLRL